MPQYHHPHSSGLVTPPPPHSQLTSPGGAANISGSSLDGEGEDELVRDVKSLYEIGKFLEFSFLCQCCEDLLMQVRLHLILLTTRPISLKISHFEVTYWYVVR